LGIEVGAFWGVGWGWRKAMSLRARRVGAALGVIVSTWASVIAVTVAVDSSAALVWRVLTPLGAVASWVAVWAWVKSRWTLAAAGFLVSLAVPAGYDNILSPVIIVGLTTAAGVEAFHKKRERMASTLDPNLR